MLRDRRRNEESRSLEVERKTGGKFPPKLNTYPRPIAHKYREGKLKRTLERELKVSAIVEEEVCGASCVPGECCEIVPD